MLEGMNSKRSISCDGEENKDITTIPISFCIASFGYMVIWTGIGSRVSYYNDIYGPTFFVMLNIVFYVTGLPIAVLQKIYDNYFDSKMTSRVSVGFRLNVCMISMSVCAFILPFLTKHAFIGIVCIIGVFTWSVHGTVSKAAALVKYNASIYQQFGFALPGIVSITLLFILPTFKQENSREFFFYGSLSILALLSLVAHTSILNNGHVLVVLDGKDEEINLRSNVEYSPITDGRHEESSEITVEIDSSSLEEEASLDTMLIKSAVKHTDYMHMSTIFITIFASVLQASFISFVPSKSAFPIIETLYFTRLFADMFGRPLALLHPPTSCDTIEFMLGIAILRLLFCFLFLVYVFSRRDGINSAFIIVLQVIISASSGYIVASVYDKAAALSSSQQRNYRILARMNIAFQSACACSSLAAGLVLAFNARL